jgi:mono/diheme cytochrome c family protein
MKTNFSKFFVGIALLVFALGLMSLTLGPDPWVVPDKYKTMKNPAKADDASKAAGKALFLKNCASCHGKMGLGDGPKSKTLAAPTGDMAVAAFQSQSDGEIFYKTKFGKGDMPKYDKKIPDEDIWALVNFMRTLKK